MSFENIETSTERGEPIDLYKVIYGPGVDDFYAFTDAEEPVVFDEITFIPEVIFRNEVTASGTTDRTTMAVKMPLDNPIPELFRVYPPSFTVIMIIWQGHVGSDEYKVQWTGKILSCTRSTIDAEVTGEPVAVSMQRIGLRRNYQYMCPHVLYGEQCRASKAAASAYVTAFAAAGRQVTLTGVLTSQALYAGGMIQWTNAAGRIEYRTILEAGTVGGRTVLTLGGIARDIGPGKTLYASKGCAHTLAACNSVHANGPNYGGQPFIPTKNPLGRSTPFL